MHGRDVVGERASKAQRVQGSLVYTADGQNDAFPHDAGRRGVRLQRETLGQSLIVVMNDVEDADDRGHEDEHDPRAVCEFGYGKYHCSRPRSAHAPTALMVILSCQRGSGCSGVACWWTTYASSPLVSLPVLNQRRAMPAWERVKDRKTPMAYSGIKAVTLAWKMMISTHGDQRKEDDAPREDQPAAPKGQVTRQKAIGGQQCAEARKVGKRGICGHDQDDGSRSHHQIVEDILPVVDRARHLRDHGFGSRKERRRSAGSRR